MPKQSDQALTPIAKSTLKVIFLTLFLDLVGFSIIFPLFPELLKYYLENDPENIDILETLKDIALYNKDYQKALDVTLKIEKEDGLSSKSSFQKSLLYEQLDQD